VLQLNICGSRSQEGLGRKDILLRTLEEHQVDVCALQETNLGTTDDTPKFKGWTVLRQDRRVNRQGAAPIGRNHGGVITLVKEGLQFEVLPNPLTVTDLATDALAVKIFTRTGSSVTVTNVYKPPVRNAHDDAREDNFNPDNFYTGSRSFVVGDFNAHYATWDYFKDEDAMGQLLDDWATDKHMCCVNDGSATRRDNATGKPSAPDITFVSEDIVNRISWRPLEDIGTDHLPLLTEMPIGRGKARWCIRKADWPAYQGEIRRRLLEVAESNQMANTDAAYKTFTNIIIEAAKVSVPRGRRKEGKAWWNDEVEMAVRAAREAKDAWLEYPEDEELKEIWKIQQRTTTRCIRNAKGASYQELLDGMDLRKDPGAPFRLIKAMDAPSGNPRDAAIKHRTGVAVSAKEKADLAIGHYANISRLIRKKANDKDVRARSRPLPTCRGTCDFCAPFTMCELKTVLSNQGGKAPGNDQVFP
jgi:hypothetical protein